SFLAIDGLVVASEVAQSDQELKLFVHELQALAAFTGCTTLLLTSAESRRVNAEHTMVDGVLSLEFERSGSRSERRLEVRKLRGSDYLLGAHWYRIDGSGWTLYPRLEAVATQPP